MPSQNKLDQYYMSLALRVAELSHGVRGKVGACLVTESDITILGTNGKPKPLGNQLEELKPIGLHNGCVVKGLNLVTSESVIHAELNTVLKCAKEGVSVSGATIYTTLSPCVSCSSMLASCGIKRLVYLKEYRDTKGIDILKQCDIVVEKLDSVF